METATGMPVIWIPSKRYFLVSLPLCLHVSAFLLSGHSEQASERARERERVAARARQRERERERELKREKGFTTKYPSCNSDHVMISNGP